MLPNLSNQNGESSVLRRILGSSGNSGSPGNKLSPERKKAQRAVLDSMLDPCSVEGMAAMSVQEPHRSSCFANLQKLRAELSNEPAIPTSRDLNKSGRIIAVQEVKHAEESGRERNNALNRGKDGRPLKSLHWKALGRTATEYRKRHLCEGNSWKCEKCRHILEVKKATERFEANRAAKQALKESKIASKELKEAESQVGQREQRIKREERFCRITAPNARTVVQRSKNAPGEDVTLIPVGVNSKWAQPVLSEMPEGVYVGRPIDYNKHIEATDSEETQLERGERNSPSCVSKLKFIREYMDHEPDFESEEIASWELAPRSQANMVFIPPGWCEPERYESSTSLEPRIRIIDTSCGENDFFANSTESRGLSSLRKLIQGKTQDTEVIELKGTGKTESWNDVVITLQELDEKASLKFKCDSEEVSGF